MVGQQKLVRCVTRCVAADDDNISKFIRASRSDKQPATGAVRGSLVRRARTGEKTTRHDTQRVEHLKNGQTEINAAISEGSPKEAFDIWL